LNKLQTKLQTLKDNNKKALVAYLVAGDPDLDTTLQLMHLFVNSGVDVIEIGVPFTDPIAEGPIIQKAHDRALKKDISLKNIIDMVIKFRETNADTPIVLMGYLNTFISHSDLIEESDKLGIDALLVVDIPGELKLNSYGISNPNIDTISLISPTTADNRIKQITENSSGFIYYVNLRGVTGSSNLDMNEIEKNISKIRQYTSIPTLAGFGIKTPSDAKILAKCADGVIVGSSIVEMIDAAKETKDFSKIEEYLKDLHRAIN
jgi:tryptophan synthase alpha chain